MEELLPILIIKVINIQKNKNFIIQYYLPAPALHSIY